VQIDQSVDRENAIYLHQPFYEIEDDKVELEKTASFGEQQDLLKYMPSFAKIGFLSHNALEKKKVNIEEAKEEKKQVIDEIGPEYLSINPEKNLQAGYFYLAKAEEKKQFEKKSPRKRTIILDIPGVLVAFADKRDGGISSAQ
jgi:hypothetical protein